MNFSSLLQHSLSDEAEFEKFTLDDGNIVWGEDWDLIFHVGQLHSGVKAFRAHNDGTMS